MIRYSLPGIAPDELCGNTLAAMIANGAFNADTAMAIPPHEFQQVCLLRDMEQRGFAQAVDPHGWHLTSDGLAALHMSQGLHSPQKLCEPNIDGKSVNQMTNFEMLLVLEQAGWSWQPLPKKALRDASNTLVQRDGAFTIDGPRTF